MTMWGPLVGLVWCYWMCALLGVGQTPRRRIPRALT